MSIDLSKYTWPERDTEIRSKPEGGQLVRSAFDTFVSEGALFVRTIDFNGQMRAIPRECSMISALASEDGVVYGATRGEQSWLFQYALPSFRDAAIPLGPIPDSTDVRGIAIIDKCAYAAVNSGSEGRIVKITGIGLPWDVIQEWGLPRAKFETVTTPVLGERIVRLIRSNVDNVLYGLTAPGGILFRFEPESTELKIIGPVDPVKFFGPVLIEDSSGDVYTFGTLGKMARYSPFMTTNVEPTGIRVPCFPGRGPYARISAAVFDPSNRRIYVGDTEGLLSMISLEDETVTTLGKPVPQGGIDHLARIPDGRIYGVAGGLDGMSHLFVHDPRAGSLRDLGVCCATVEKGWYGYRFGAMLATPEGRIILGEDDHLGCVFSYFPPM